MKGIDCEVIQDLLPSYSDQITSDQTNKLVFEHLQNCKKCEKAFKEMNKDINVEELYDQEEKINYLKEYKRNKRRNIIFAITITIIIINSIYLVLDYILPLIFEDTEFFVDISKINVEYMYKSTNYIGRDQIVCYLYSQRYKNIQATPYKVYKDDGSIEVHYIIVAKDLINGMFSNFNKSSYSGEYMYVGLEDETLEKDIDRIYIEDKLGNKKEIWNKYTKVQSKEEWAKWYIDDYVPEEIKEKYHMNYSNVEDTTANWRSLYE